MICRFLTNLSLWIRSLSRIKTKDISESTIVILEKAVNLFIKSQDSYLYGNDKLL